MRVRLVEEGWYAHGILDSSVRSWKHTSEQKKAEERKV